MKANKLFLLAGLLLSGSIIPITAQNKKEKKQQREQAVREAVDAKAYKINVDRVMPMKGGSKHLTSDYSLEIRNDSVYSYLLVGLLRLDGERQRIAQEIGYLLHFGQRIVVRQDNGVLLAFEPLDFRFEFR